MEARTNRWGLRNIRIPSIFFAARKAILRQYLQPRFAERVQGGCQAPEGR